METSTTEVNEDITPSTRATTPAATVPAPKEEPQPSTKPSVLCALTRFGRASFSDLTEGTYLVSIACSHHLQVVSVSGRALYERLQPLSNRDNVQALIRISEGEPLSIGITAPDKVPTDGVLVTVVPVQFI